MRTGRFPFRANGKAMAIGDTDGFVKLVVDSETGAVLGYHIIGHNATELLGEASLGAVLETTPLRARLRRPRPPDALRGAQRSRPRPHRRSDPLLHPQEALNDREVTET